MASGRVHRHPGHRAPSPRTRAPGRPVPRAGPDESGSDTSPDADALSSDPTGRSSDGGPTSPSSAASAGAGRRADASSDGAGRTADSSSTAPGTRRPRTDRRFLRASGGHGRRDEDHGRAEEGPKEGLRLVGPSAPGRTGRFPKFSSRGRIAGHGLPLWFYPFPPFEAFLRRVRSALGSERDGSTNWGGPSSWSVIDHMRPARAISVARKINLFTGILLTIGPLFERLVRGVSSDPTGFAR